MTGPDGPVINSGVAMVKEDLYEKAAGLISGSKMTVALTGAGISTPSGIPDFRSPVSGLWEKVDPVEVATIDAFLKKPDKFFAFMEPISQMMDTAMPNAAHETLASWESRGLLHSVITQNIDNLHQKAGSMNVLELHGNARRAFCMKCRREYTPEQLKEKLKAASVPYCDCEKMGIIKPDVILFGEQLPFQTLLQAEQDAKECEVMVVVGSSLTVTPASMLPQIAIQGGAKVIVVNLQRTYIDSAAEVVLNEKIEIALPEIAARTN